MALRKLAMDAHRAANDASSPSAAAVARAASLSASAPYLHPISSEHQIWHILGAVAYAIHAYEVEPLNRNDLALNCLERAIQAASPVIHDVLKRYPPAPSWHGRPGEILRQLDAALRR